MAEPAQLTLALTGPVDSPAPSIRFSKRARKVTLKVHADGRVEVVAPLATSEAYIARFVAANHTWIEETRSRQLMNYSPVDRSRPDAMQLDAIGESWRLVRRPHKGNALRVRVLPDASPGEFVVCVDGSADASEEQQRQAVRRVVIERARRMFKQALPPLAAELGSHYRRLQVRDQKTCWGSYSSSGTLSMNYAAVFLPKVLMRYLCAHELAHYHFMDHSQNFWRCVEQAMPEARALDRQLGSTRAVVPAWLWS